MISNSEQRRRSSSHTARLFFITEHRVINYLLLILEIDSAWSLSARKIDPTFAGMGRDIVTSAMAVPSKFAEGHPQ